MSSARRVTSARTPSAKTIDNCRAANDCRRMKNALQMDPVATGPSDSRFITKVYIGDLDGKVWRFALGMAGHHRHRVGADAAVQRRRGPSAVLVDGDGQRRRHEAVHLRRHRQRPAAVEQRQPAVQPARGARQRRARRRRRPRFCWRPRTASPPDEKVTAFPAVAGDIVFFTTTTINPTTPCTPFTANLYAFTFIGGPAYDTNNDGQLTAPTGSGGGKKGGGGGATAPTAPRSSRRAGARATAPFIVDQHLVFCGRRQDRDVRRSERLQQRRRPGRRAHPVLAAGEVAIVHDVLSALSAAAPAGMGSMCSMQAVPARARSAGENRADRGARARVGSGPASVRPCSRSASAS